MLSQLIRMYRFHFRNFQTMRLLNSISSDGVRLNLSSQSTLRRNFTTSTPSLQMPIPNYEESLKLIEKMKQDPELNKLLTNKEILLEVKKLFDLFNNKGIKVEEMGNLGPMQMLKLLGDKEIREQASAIQNVLDKEKIVLEPAKLMKLLGR